MSPSIAMLFVITLFFSFLTITPHEVAAVVYHTGSKTFEITDYSIVKNGISTGNYIESDNFPAGGYQWVIQVYPLGWNTAYSDSITVFVTLASSAYNVQAIYTHRLYDWTTSTWSTDTPASSNVVTFSGPGNGWGYFSFIKRSVLEASHYFKDDKFMIKSTLWVVRGSSTSLMSPLSDISSDKKDPRNLTIAGIPFENNSNNQASA